MALRLQGLSAHFPSLELTDSTITPLLAVEAALLSDLTALSTAFYAQGAESQLSLSAGLTL